MASPRLPTRSETMPCLVPTMVLGKIVPDLHHSLTSRKASFPLMIPQVLRGDEEISYSPPGVYVSIGNFFDPVGLGESKRSEGVSFV